MKLKEFFDPMNEDSLDEYGEQMPGWIDRPGPQRMSFGGGSGSRVNRKARADYWKKQAADAQAREERQQADAQARVERNAADRARRAARSPEEKQADSAKAAARRAARSPEQKQDDNDARAMRRGRQKFNQDPIANATLPRMSSPGAGFMDFIRGRSPKPVKVSDPNFPKMRTAFDSQDEGKKNMKPNLKEFFSHLNEGPLDSTFKPPAEVPVDGGAGDEMGGESPEMTQDVAKMSASSLQFFTKNVQSAVSKYNLEAEGFDTSSLQQFAGALDSLAFNTYQQVQEPAARQGFEADYQKLAADWSKDLTKLFDKLQKLKSHANPY